MSESCYNNQLKEAVEERLDSILWALEDIRKYYRGEPGALRLIEEDIDSAIHSYAIGAPGPSFALHAKGFVERLPE